MNDPDDPGGATKYGVTVRTMRRLGIDLDGDGDTDAQDVKRLSREQARDLLIKHYFRAPGLHRLPDALQATVFDMQVNAGSQAIRILQRLMRDMGEHVRMTAFSAPRPQVRRGGPMTPPPSTIRLPGSSVLSRKARLSRICFDFGRKPGMTELDPGVVFQAASEMLDRPRKKA